MADDDDDVDYMQEDEAKTFTFLRPEQGIAHLLITLFVITFYITLFTKFLSEHKDELLTGLFSHICLCQGILDVIFLLLEGVFNLPRYFPRTWSFYYGLNETAWTTALELTEAYLFVSSSINVCFLAVERIAASFCFLAPIHTVLERIPRIIVLLIKLLIPAIPVRTLYGLDLPFFAFAETQTLVGLFTMHHGAIQTDNVGPYIMVSTAITVAIFGVIAAKVLINCGSTKMTDDLRRTVLFVALIVPQLASGIFAGMGTKARDEGDLDRAFFITGNLLNVSYFFVLTGPLVIIASRRARGVLFKTSPSSVSSVP